jgi:hypothetical protein
MGVADNPAFVSAADARLSEDEWVVGLTFDDATFAYPYSTLFNSPVVIQMDHDKRLMLLWSAYANRALAVMIEHDLKGRDLEVVSTPANALLIYNSRRGQFINGLTGQTTRHEKPAGFTGDVVPTRKMTWKDWRTLHPDTQVLARPGGRPAYAPTQPIEPVWPMPPGAHDAGDDSRIAMVGSIHPLAVNSNEVTATPLNATADEVRSSHLQPRGKARPDRETRPQPAAPPASPGVLPRPGQQLRMERRGRLRRCAGRGKIPQGKTS